MFMQWYVGWGQAATYGSWSSVLTMWVVGIKLKSFTSWPISGAPLWLLKRWGGKGFLKDLYSLYHIPEITTTKIAVYISRVFCSLGLETFDIKQKKPLLYSTYLLVEAHIKIYENILCTSLFIVVHYLSFGGSTSCHLGGVRDRASFISVPLQR